MDTNIPRYTQTPPAQLASRPLLKQNPDYPQGSLAEALDEFGVLKVDRVDSCIWSPHFNSVYWAVIAEGVEGPKTGQATLDEKPGTALLGVAMSAQVAQRVWIEIDNTLMSISQGRRIRGIV